VHDGDRERAANIEKNLVFDPKVVKNKIWGMNKQPDMFLAKEKKKKIKLKFNPEMLCNIFV